eukprot:gene5126-7142_t
MSITKTSKESYNGIERRHSKRLIDNYQNYRVPTLLNSMFELDHNKSSSGLTTEPNDENILGIKNNENNPFISKKMRLIHRNPNVYYISNFLSPKEIKYFDALCTANQSKFKKSFTDSLNEDKVISSERTSNYLSISKGQDRVIRKLEQRASDLVGLHTQNVEPFQIVSYSNGQRFTVHHDAGTLLEDGTVEIVQPRRVVTLFIYLNTLPHGQGHTEFPLLLDEHDRSLNEVLSIRPEAGCGVLFCNINNDGTADPRLAHQALPVIGNLVKYGLNIWICDGNIDVDEVDTSIKRKKKMRVKGMDEQISLVNEPSMTLFERANQAAEQYLEYKASSINRNSESECGKG